MIELDIPGFGQRQLAHLVCDYNGTLAVDGHLLPGVGELLTTLAAQLHLHVITADTFGLARSQLAGLPVSLSILPADDQANAKKSFVAQLGASSTAAIGNGRNDLLMLETAAIGIAVLQREGAAAITLMSSDLVCPSITDALALFHARCR